MRPGLHLPLALSLFRSPPFCCVVCVAGVGDGARWLHLSEGDPCWIRAAVNLCVLLLSSSSSSMHMPA